MFIITLVMQCINYFSHYYDKMPDEKNLKRKVLFGLQFESTISHEVEERQQDCEAAAYNVASVVWKQRTINAFFLNTV